MVTAEREREQDSGEVMISYGWMYIADASNNRTRGVRWQCSCTMFAFVPFYVDAAETERRALAAMDQHIDTRHGK